MPPSIPLTSSTSDDLQHGNHAVLGRPSNNIANKTSSRNRIELTSSSPSPLPPSSNRRTATIAATSRGNVRRRRHTSHADVGGYTASSSYRANVDLLDGVFGTTAGKGSGVTLSNNNKQQDNNYNQIEDQQQRQHIGVDSGNDTTMTMTDASYNTSNNNNSGLMMSTSSSPYGYYGSPGMAGGMMMPPISPMMIGLGGLGGPFSGLYQALYGLQNIAFSISQAVHLIGMNQQVLQQAWESISQMVDHAIATFHEMRALEQKGRAAETEEEKQRRRRLKALRYAVVFGGSWLAYKLVRHLLFQQRRRKIGQINHALPSSYPYDSMVTSRAFMPSSHQNGFGIGPGSYGSSLYANGTYGGGFSGGMY